MIKYKTGSFGGLIIRKEVTKETKKFVCLSNGIREAKSSAWGQYFDTFKEAKAFLLENQKIKIIRYKEDLEEAVALFQEIKLLKE